MEWEGNNIQMVKIVQNLCISLYRSIYAMWIKKTREGEMCREGDTENRECDEGEEKCSN